LKELLPARLHKKITHVKFRDKELETKIEILRDLRLSRPRLEKTSLETRLETETKSRDSITDAQASGMLIMSKFHKKCLLQNPITDNY